MELFLQQALDGLINGCIYAMVALGLVLIYRTTQVVNFAQGEMATFAAFVAWTFSSWGIPLWVALALTAVLAFVVGAGIERCLVRRVYTTNPLPPIIITIGLWLALNALAVWIWDPVGRLMPPLLGSVGSRVFELPGGAHLNGHGVTIIASLVVVGAVLWYVMRRTTMGLLMAAVASNAESSVLVGIHVGRIRMVSWGAAAATGALAGVLVAPRLTLAPNMMLIVFLYALASATLGGFDSPTGAVVGGLVVGLAEALSATYVPFVGADMKLAVAIVLIVGVLLVRPAGLFGSTRVVRV